MASHPTTIHNRAIKAIKAGIDRAIEGRSSYKLRWRCPKCGEVTKDELAPLDTPTHVSIEKQVVGRTRSDLFVQWGDLGECGTLVIEVVDNHNPTLATSNRYRESGVHVVIVRVETDADVTALEAGIDTRGGINYPPTPCVECERRESAREQSEGIFECQNRVEEVKILESVAGHEQLELRMR